ncbi:MAG: hypothetical protein A4E73_00373 [Syntrophaceae bacterium PtaU1.Bin231]|nr:MAG: hypothetical protein A4E73_00373 [Syntrophaceae bacterium PtaU1.Bin231]
MFVPAPPSMYPLKSVSFSKTKLFVPFPPMMLSTSTAAVSLLAPLVTSTVPSVWMMNTRFAVTAEKSRVSKSIVPTLVRVSVPHPSRKVKVLLAVVATSVSLPVTF